MKAIRSRILLLLLLCLTASAARSADENDTQTQIAKMLLQRARSDYEVVSKAKAANHGLLQSIEQHLQPYLERRDGELVYNFRKSASASAQPGLNQIQELVEWHEKAVRRHFYYTEESIKTGVKLNDALNRMEELKSEAHPYEPDDQEHHELEEE